MRMVDLITKKRDGNELADYEISKMIEDYVADLIPDYQMAAMLMAIFYQGMTDAETLAMTNAVAQSGDMVDLSSISGIKVDKHSTGGVGDKTTLIIAPIVAACGVKVAKMSGRGLGHTGGTVDKMEAIPGLKTTLTQEEFFKVVNQTGLSVIGQSGNLTPADKKLYALRDVTATVNSIPLIAVSIMSKKLAAGSDCILLDVKTGSGAFMKTVEESIELAQKMVAIGENAGKKTVALITNMDIPLGNNIGNSLEIIEVIETLQGKGPKDLTEVSIELAANMLFLANQGELEQCKEKVRTVIKNGSALERLKEMIKAQGGNLAVIEDTNQFEKATFQKEVLARQEGFITHMDTEKCGIAASMLGAGRETKDSSIDFAAGIILKAKVGDKVKKGQSIATLYTSKEVLLTGAELEYQKAIVIEEEKQNTQPLIYGRVTIDTVEKI